MTNLEKTHERDRHQLIQLVLASSQGEESCSADNLCLHRRQLIAAMDEPYRIKINWPQITTGEGADRPVELYHVICWDAMIDTERLLPKKLFPKMVENESGDFKKIGLMARQWLKYSGNVFPDRMSQILERLKTIVKPGDDIAEVWRLKCKRELWHVADKTCSLSAILLMGDTYV